MSDLPALKLPLHELRWQATPNADNEITDVLYIGTNLSKSCLWQVNSGSEALQVFPYYLFMMLNYMYITPE